MVSLYGDSKELWKTGCTCHVFGRTNLLLVAAVETTLKGPCRWGASLAFGCVVWILVSSSQTRSPVWNTWDSVLGLVRFMISEATSRAAVTSDRTWFIVRNRSDGRDSRGKLGWGVDFGSIPVPNFERGLPRCTVGSCIVGKLYERE